MFGHKSSVSNHTISAVTSVSRHHPLSSPLPPMIYGLLPRYALMRKSERLGYPIPSITRITLDFFASDLIHAEELFCPMSLCPSALEGYPWRTPSQVLIITLDRLPHHKIPETGHFKGVLFSNCTCINLYMNCERGATCIYVASTFGCSPKFEN